MKAVLRDAIDGSGDDGFLALSQLLCRALAGLRPVCASAPFNEALVRLQEHSDAQAATLAPSSLEAALGGLGYAPGEGRRDSRGARAFHHGNQAYLLIATLARLLLEGGRFGDEQCRPRPSMASRPTQAAPAVLMELITQTNPPAALRRHQDHQQVCLS